MIHIVGMGGTSTFSRPKVGAGTRAQGRNGRHVRRLVRGREGRRFGGDSALRDSQEKVPA
jgi:hypothetical protein